MAKATNAPIVPAGNNPAPLGNGNNNTPPLAAPAAPYTGKYTAKATKLGGAAVVPAFKYSAMALYCNTAPNTAPQKATSVMGKVYALVKANPGVTGAALTTLMQGQNWQGHPTKYVAGGVVCALWCQGYIVGACSNKHKHLVAKAAPVAAGAPVAATAPVAAGAPNT